MNLAQLLARIARVDPARPALYVGDRLLRRYDELADRAARLPATSPGAGLRAGRPGRPADDNHPAIWKCCTPPGGPASRWCRSTRSCTRGGRVDRRASRRALGCSSPPTSPTASRRSAPACARRSSRHAPATPLRSPTRRRAGGRAPRTTSPGSSTPGHHRPAQGRDAHPSQPRDHGLLLHRRRRRRPDDAIVYAAPMSHGAGIYNLALRRPGGAPRRAGFGRLRSRPSWSRWRAASAAVCLFAAPTMVKRLVDHARPRAARRCDGFKTIVYGGGPMYGADIRRALRDDGAALRADLRPGRKRR